MWVFRFVLHMRFVESAGCGAALTGSQQPSVANDVKTTLSLYPGGGCTAV